MKIKKRKKSTRMLGRRMGTHGGGARVNRKKSGSKGGVGMAGSGKRGDQKKTLILKKYGNKYFGKKGITSRKTEKKKELTINIKGIQNRFPEGKVDLEGYKVLGSGEVRGKFVIKARAASKSASEKIRKAGGEIVLGKKGEETNKEKIKKPEKVKENFIVQIVD